MMFTEDPAAAAGVSLMLSVTVVSAAMTPIFLLFLFGKAAEGHLSTNWHYATKLNWCTDMQSSGSDFIKPAFLQPTKLFFFRFYFAVTADEDA